MKYLLVVTLLFSNQLAFGQTEEECGTMYQVSDHANSIAGEAGWLIDRTLKQDTPGAKQDACFRLGRLVATADQISAAAEPLWSFPKIQDEAFSLSNDSNGLSHYCHTDNTGKGSSSVLPGQKEKLIKRLKQIKDKASAISDTLLDKAC